MEVLYYQLFIFGTIVLTRVFKKDYLIGICIFWTLFTIVNLFYPPLIFIQLGVVWVTFAFLKDDEDVSESTRSVDKAKVREKIKLFEQKKEAVVKSRIDDETIIKEKEKLYWQKIEDSKRSVEESEASVSSDSLTGIKKPLKIAEQSETPIITRNVGSQINKPSPPSIALTHHTNAQISFPEGYESDPEVLRVVQAIRASANPILVTGKAGTGKSTLVRYIRDCGKFQNSVVLAPTGIAAVTISGQTIHSFFRIPPRIFTPEILKGQRSNKVWSKVQMIIIDEVSMVRADLMDAIDYILKRERNSELPFGGTKMLFVGDFHQLPPVVPDAEKQMLERMGYKSQFAYDAKVFNEITIQKFELETVHRQSESNFLNILSDIRNSPSPQNSLRSLNEACYRPHRPEAVPLMLTGTNAAASKYNSRGLEKIDLPIQTYVGVTTGKFNITKTKLPAPENLYLKIGARVMALKNDASKAWVNGSLGTVTLLEDNRVWVKFDHLENAVDVIKVQWENIKYEWDEEAGRPVSKVIGSYSQIPLNLAWAVTIHKAQGLTLSDVRVDLEGGAFASGQAYVAFSRARTLAGLSLARPVNIADIIVERRHAKFFNPKLIDTKSTLSNSPERLRVMQHSLGAIEKRTYKESTGLIPTYTLRKFDSDIVQSVDSDFSQKLEISYLDSQGNLTLRDVDANFIVEPDEGACNYLVGHCGLRNERRSFRFDRIQRLYDVEKENYITEGISQYLENLRSTE